MERRGVFMLVGIVIGCLIVIGLYLFLGNGDIVEDPLKIEINLSDYYNDTYYEGPVPMGYDEDNFRETGDTIKEDVNGSEENRTA